MGENEKVDIAVLKSDVASLKSWSHDLTETLNDLKESVTELRITVASVVQKPEVVSSGGAVPFWKSESFWMKIIIGFLTAKTGGDVIGSMIGG